MGWKQFLIYLFRSWFFPRRPVTMEWQMWRYLNKARKQHGLKAVWMQSDLRVVARLHSKDMAKLDYFEHTNLRGQSHADRYKEARIGDLVSGENLAKIGGFPFPVEQAHKGLMNSPGHRANILNGQYNCVGVGLHRSEDKVYYFTQNFAKRDLFFSKTPAPVLRVGKKYYLKFIPIEPVSMGLLRITQFKETVSEKTFRINPGGNSLPYLFSETGPYLIQIFTATPAQVKTGQLHLSHQWEVQLKPSRLFFF
jgi:hypothetical protein